MKPQINDSTPYSRHFADRRGGKPGEPGQDWRGSVTGFQPSGSIDFHYSIEVRQLRATVDVHIHYSFEEEGQGTVVNPWLILDFTMPVAFRALRPAITSSRAGSRRSWPRRRAVTSWDGRPWQVTASRRAFPRREAQVW